MTPAEALLQEFPSFVVVLVVAVVLLVAFDWLLARYERHLQRADPMRLKRAAPRGRHRLS